MEKTIDFVSESPRLGEKKIVWLSSLVFGFDNVVSQTEMAKCLSQRAAAVYLFAMTSKVKPQGKSHINFVLFPISFVPTIAPLLYTLALLIFMPFLVIARNPDYIITDEGTAGIGLILKLLTNPLKSKVVLDIRSTPIKVKGTFRESLHALWFRVSVIIAKKKLDGITILTELMKKEVCYEFDINPEFVGVWTSGVSTALFNPGNFDSHEIRMRLGLDDRFVVFYHGALRPQGLVETFQAVKLLKAKCYDLTLFLLVGAPRYSEFWKNLALDLGIQNNVVMHERVGYSNVPEYISMSDLAIVPLPNSPSWRYQCPLKLLEYLAMRKAVIVTDIPANREIIGKSQCGIFIHSVDPEEIAKAIAFSHDNRESLRQWGSYGRAIIEEKYTWERIARKFEDYLLSL
jgi:glycosyltransferase involved in cell wall biosynthesis